MNNEAGESVSIDNLIAALEAAEQGSRTLDIQLAYCLGEITGASAAGSAGARLPAKWHALGEFPAIAKIMLDEGFSWQSVCELLDCEAPAYTTSLDASIPGENIALVIRSAKRNRWGAIHMTAQGEEISGWAATEALARRTAGLKAWTKAALQAPEGRIEDPESRQVPVAAGRAADEEPENRSREMNRGGDGTAPRESLDDAFEQQERDWEILF